MTVTRRTFLARAAASLAVLIGAPAVLTAWKASRAPITTPSAKGLSSTRAAARSTRTVAVDEQRWLWPLVQNINATIAPMGYGLVVQDGLDGALIGIVYRQGSPFNSLISRFRVGDSATRDTLARIRYRARSIRYETIKALELALGHRIVVDDHGNLHISDELLRTT